MKILVTGVLGFIGSYFAKYAIRTLPYSRIVGLARNTTQKHLKRMEDVLYHQRFSLVYCDLSKNDISELLEGVEYVFHFAAKTFVDHSVIAPQPFVESNIIGTYRLLESVRKYKIKKFFHISTDEVYGQISLGAWKEDAPLNPTNPYSMSKACSDLIALAYFKTYGVPIVITRAENIYGPYQHPQKVIPAWTKKALDDEPLPIYGDGKQKRTWLHVEDNVRALLHLIKHGKVGEIYHIAGGKEIENFELAKRILKILGKPVNSTSALKFIPDEKIRPFHDRRYALNSEKLRATGWKPKYSLEEGLENTVEWFKLNMWWY